MKVGDLVKFSEPDSSEEMDRFVVVELRGDRVLVELITSQFRIKPTFVYTASDLDIVE